MRWVFLLFRKMGYISKKNRRSDQRAEDAESKNIAPKANQNTVTGTSILGLLALLGLFAFTTS